MDYYVRMSDQIPSLPPTKYLVIGYICQIILYALIITYCVLSPSLFSTIALAFMLISIYATIATPYYLLKPDKKQKKVSVVAYPLERIIWGIFIIINLGIFGFKISVIIMNSYDQYTNNQKLFYEIENYLYMFLPLLLLPFAASSCIIRTKNRNTSDFHKKINNTTSIPIFLSLGILNILIQIFSLSVAGFCFFLCALALYVQRKLKFDNIWSEILVTIICFLCFGYIVANFITTTELIMNQPSSSMYNFYGINSLNNFLSQITARGYFICLIIQFLLTCLTQRVFIYYRIWKISSQILNTGQIAEQEIFGDQGIKIQKVDSIQPQGLPDPSMKKFQMQSVRDSRSVMEEPHRSNTDNPVFRSLPVHQQKSSLVVQKSQAISKFHKFLDSILRGMNSFVDFIYSAQFCLRVTEILSIIVISRYNNIYSYVAVFWLATVASIEKIKIILYITGFILVPVQLSNFIIMYFYNTPQSPLSQYTNMQIYGFFKMPDFWLDIIIFNLYFFYMITFLLAASRDSRQTFKKALAKPKVSILVLMLAFIFRYTYLLTILALFFMGFSVVNLMNLIYVIMFLVFFSSGDNMIQQKIKKGNKQYTKLTTFSRKYWQIIVYYTLLCVIAKYTYFLFFRGQVQQQLQPTGINYQYHWSFNFSLSSTCLSNTTPLFIIFILSQAQIIIFRSPIYLNYSYSLMNQFGEKTSNKKSKLNFFTKMIETVLQFYYQSLYYVSGFIILLCSYRWDLNGLITVILACWGLILGFSKKILAMIVFFDLGFMLANYLALFIDYEIVVETIGQNVKDTIYKLSLFMGFKMDAISDLTNVFALSIVIFYFAVESYRLCKILEQSRINQQGQINNITQEMNDEQRQQQQFPDAISNFEGQRVIEQEYQQLQFVKNYNKNVIIGTKILYNVKLWRKYKIWNYICKFLSIFMIDVIAILVVVLCLNFRISVSMLYYLTLYMFFYYNLFNDVGKQMMQDQFYQKIFREIRNFQTKLFAIKQRQNPRSIINGQQATQSVSQFIDYSRVKALKLKQHWKQIIWKYSSFFSAICLILSYTSQFFISDFYTTYLNYSWTLVAEQILFVLGISVLQYESYARQTYFYYLMMGIAVIQMLILKYIKDISEEKQSEDIYHKSFDFKIYSELSDPQQFINQDCDFIQRIQLQEQLNLEEEVFDYQRQRLSYEDDCAKQSNLLIYFDYKKAVIKINFTYGIMMTLLRFYLLMLMINVYEQANLFSFAYLIAVLYFWFQTMRFQLVNDINKAAIVILLLQYFALLLDISPETSPLTLPNKQNLSLLTKLLGDSKWISFILFVPGQKSYNVFIEAFLIGSIIIFMTQFYYTIFFMISKSIIRGIRSIYDRYEYIQQKLQQMPKNDTIYLNYDNYKSASYRILNLSYQLLINNSYIVVSILILILLSGVHTYVSVGLVIFACIYIYLGIFTQFSEDLKLFSYTSIFFKIIQGILFTILILATITTIPFTEQQSSLVTNFAQLSNLTQIFLILFIQLWLDLSITTEFKQATIGYNSRVRNRQNVLIKCLAYQENSDFIRRLIQRYKQVMWFQVNLADALQIIDQWHRNMYKQKIPQFQNIKDNLAPLPMDDLRQQIKQQLARRPDQDEPFVNNLQSYMAEHINVTIQYRYFQIMKFIVFNNHRLLSLQNENIDIWDYVLQNYEKLYNQIKQSENSLQNITKIIQNQYQGERMYKLQEIKQQEYSAQELNLDQRIMGTIKTPQKIFLDIKSRSNSFFKTFWDFFVSNFSYFLSFFIWIYYLINPCLLSLPFIVYLFSYQIISDHKLTSLMLLYVFSIIVFAMLVQLDFFSDAGWIQYFFLDYSEPTFAIGYLYFIFILIFINEQIKKYQGNKFKYVHEAENTTQGALRILINADKKSELNIWKLKTDAEYEEKQCNPMNYFAQKIQKNPQHLTSMPVPGFFQSMQEGKTGKDLYPFIATVQIFLTIYMIFLYPFMVHSEAASLADSFKYFQFSSGMVLGVLANVFVIVIERWITLLRGDPVRKLKIKYWYTMLILFLFLLFIYYIAPKNHYVSNVYYPQPCLIAFSFFYFFYFFISGLQIRFGYKKYKSLNSIMTRRRQFNNFILIGYVNIPFLYQLKLSMDWAFCQTSLKIFDWFRLFSIYYSAFKAKMQYYSSTGVTLGKPVSSLMKSLGWITFIGILMIIFLPMILFSGLNPIAQTNLVIGGTMSLGIQIKNGNYFELYSTSHFAFPPKTYTYDLFKYFGFNQVPLLSTLTSKDVQDQFQFVSYQPYSDNNWGISTPNFNTLLQKIQDAIKDMEKQQDPQNQFQIVVQYELYRRIASTIPQNNKFYYPEATTSQQYLNLQQLQDINNTINNCGKSSYFPNFYIDLIRLDTIGDTYKPRPINYTLDNGTQPYLKGIYLTLYCDNQLQVNNTNNVYWGVNTTAQSDPNADQASQSGVNLNVYCDKYQNLIGGLGFTALYTSVILVVANLIRGAFQSDLPNIPYFQNPKSDNIIQISQAIGTLRSRKQFREQYLMYYELIDIIRSPDMMKFLSGSYPAIIEAADAKRARKQRQQQLAARKNKIQ